MAEVVVALDVPSAAEAVGLAGRLPGLTWAKIGPMLFLDAGPALVKSLKDKGIRVFLDLKWHDIPHAVAGAVRAAVGIGVDLVTVHALGGTEMMRAAADAAGNMPVVGVTVLTSHTSESYAAAVGGRAGALEGEVARLATAAVAAGLSGVVASPLEVARVRPIVGPDRLIVVPGIRPRGSSVDDQRRIADPRSAAAAGATHLVIGRPITRAPDPRAVYEKVCEAAA